MDEGVSHIIREFWERELPQMYPRSIEGMLDDDLIRDIVGPRRSGKTYMMYLIVREIEGRSSKRACIYVNFENRRVIPRKGKIFDDIMEFIHSEGIMDEFERIFLFLDEVQHIPGWERYVRSIYDEYKGRIKIFVTGSCSDLLSDEYADLLTGRHITRRILPLSFREYLVFNDIDPKRSFETEKSVSIAKKKFDEYITRGGFPEIVLDGPNPEMSSQLYTDIISRDITSRVGIRNKEALLDLADFLVRNVGGLLSFNKISRYFKSRSTPVSVPTLISYFEMMKEAFLFFDATIFYDNIRDRKQYPRKIYCIDNSFLSASGTGKGQLLENAVARELMNRGYELHYWRSTRGDLEVDFILDPSGQPHPVQVCSDMTNMTTSEREYRALDRCMEQLGSGEGTIVTINEEDTRELSHGNAHLVPAWKFFLKDLHRDPTSFARKVSPTHRDLDPRFHPFPLRS
jgi:predicted AAA+ superfamily ATPase